MGKYTFNPLSGKFDYYETGGGVSIGDTIGGTPDSNGLLYADSSDKTIYRMI